MQVDVFQQFVERDIGPENMWVASQQQLLAGAGQGHVQLAVYQEGTFLKCIGCQKIELTEILYGKRIDNHIPLAALVTFHCVDGDVQQGGQLEAGYFFPNHGNLVAVGHDDAHRPVGVEMRLRQSVDMSQQGRHDAGFVRVGLVGTAETFGNFCRDEDHSPFQ